MNDETILSQPAQLFLFELKDNASSSLELFPKIWSAAEALTSSDVRTRLSGLEVIEELDAARYSSLIIYILATRILEPDINIRTRIVKILANVLKPDQENKITPEQVRQTLCHYLSQMRTRPIYALLETVNYDNTSENAVRQLLKGCPFAGVHLIEILIDRKNLLPVRIQAVHFIGVVGYVDAIYQLEKLADRLESRVNGQQMFSFGAVEKNDETLLLPYIRSALVLLQAP